MSRGFLKDVGGIKRLRIVKPGYDANNLNLPYNNVVFDSVLPTSVVPYIAGVVNITTAGSVMKVVTWPDPGYCPLTMVNIVRQDDGSYSSVIPWTSNNPVITVDNTGIYLSTGSLILPTNLIYFALRIPG